MDRRTFLKTLGISILGATLLSPKDLLSLKSVPDKLLHASDINLLCEYYKKKQIPFFAEEWDYGFRYGFGLKKGDLKWRGWHVDKKAWKNNPETRIAMFNLLEEYANG